ncbi:MAG: CYTH and CHAD domain-containing protein [Gammaproteobacteria bacterium]|nr:CYTH and CHAD domain-containing protein [Gammaproteobacteria bacterium]
MSAQGPCAAIEFELKLHVGERQRSIVASLVRRGRSSERHLRATYFDTPGRDLQAHQLSLRIRQEDDVWIQTAKGPTTAGPLQRLEHNVEVPAPLSGEAPEPDLDRHAGTPVGDLIRRALADAGRDCKNSELVALFTTDIRRLTREMRTGGAMVELAFDRGEVRADGRSHAVSELEIELKRGSAQSMLELAERWCRRYGLWLDTVTKASRGERLAADRVFGDAVRAVAPCYDRHATGQEMFRAVLESCLAHMLPNAAELAAGSADEEHVHQLRVGIRRTRTALRELAGFGPPIGEACESALVTAFRALGELRDRDQLLRAVQPRVEGAGGPPVQWDDAHATQHGPGDAIRAADFQGALFGLIAASLPADTEPENAAKTETKAGSEAEDAGPPDALSSARKALRTRLTKLHKRVLRDGKRFETLTIDEQHRVRKRLKRLRYLAEFAAPLFGESKVRRFLKRLTPAQDALGAYNDAAQAIAAFRERAEKDGRAWFAVGWLEAQQAQSAAGCRTALVKVAKAEPFWRASGKR